MKLSILVTVVANQKYSRVVYFQLSLKIFLYVVAYFC